MTPLDLKPAAERPLTAIEATTLDDCEQVIEKGVKTFIDVGKALQRINDGRLYRETHSTFEEYCREKWQISRRHAYRQIEAAAVTEAVCPMGHTETVSTPVSSIGNTPEPANERVARELTPLKDKPEQLQEAWRETVEQHGEKPTARQVREVVERRKLPAPTVESTPSTHAEEHGHDQLDPDDELDFLKEAIPDCIANACQKARWGLENGAGAEAEELLADAARLDLDLSFVDLSALRAVRDDLDGLIRRVESLSQRSAREAVVA